jgi:hypothetical protein
MRLSSADTSKLLLVLLPNDMEKSLVIFVLKNESNPYERAR